MSQTNRRVWWMAVAVGALTLSAVSIVQSVGYWVISAARGEPTQWMFVDHAGPSVTSFLIGIAALGIGLAALAASKRRDSTAS